MKKYRSKSDYYQALMNAPLNNELKIGTKVIIDNPQDGGCHGCEGEVIDLPNDKWPKSYLVKINLVNGISTGRYCSIELKIIK